VAAIPTSGRCPKPAAGTPIDRWLPERITYHILPFILVGTFLGVAFLTRPHAVAGIGVFALAGLGCSALLPLTISFGEGDLTAMAAAMAGGVIAFYQLGYGIAAFGVGPLQGGGTSLSAIFGFTAVIAGVTALLSFFVTRRRPAPAELSVGSSVRDGATSRPPWA
jgi:predicted MFS family arabinose efflux permease